MSFKKLEGRANYPKIEKEILKKWKDKDIFQRSIDERDSYHTYTFFDGPPFATGLPHHGHLLISTIKDIIPRYQTMKGKRVERKWGWDTHGLPIEYQKEKELGLSGKKDIEDYGIDKFNESCRSTILKYADEWKEVITRLGRWVDMENDYKTMEPWYMESIWWITKQLWDKELIYQGYKPMHICPRCATPLSNFEVAQGYKDIQDLSCTAKFEVKNSKLFKDLPNPVYMIAWTTTPWTLPGNIALAVNPEEDYVLVDIDSEYIIFAKALIEKLFKETQELNVVHEYKGTELEGIEYEPLFDIPEFDQDGKKYIVVTSEVVNMDDGTGVLHIAPAFGTDDYNIGQEKGLAFLQHITIEGIVKPYVKDFAGKVVKTNDDYTGFDKEICNDLEARGLLFKKETYNHSYPLCWRCETPLLNYAFDTWFIKIEGKLKDKMIEKNKEMNWVPEFAGHSRFANWIENAPDWAFSRNRYWGAPLPFWKGFDKDGNVKDIICIESIEELKKRSRVEKITDLHKHHVDQITWEENGLTYKRVEEVFDCWFESGAMPYASNHYPFKDAETFENRFPADFIIEAMDQTRGWFYTLLVESAALFEDMPAKNVVVTGLLLAEDGRKLSKSKRNYTDPTELFETKGVDAFRFALVNSPVVKGENAKFTDSIIDEKIKTILAPFWSALSFFTTYANIDGWSPESLKRMYVMRHGETQMNNDGYIQGANENPNLDERGKDQAKNVTARFSKIKLDKIYSSPQKRAVETVENLAQNQKIEIEKDERIKEIDMGEIGGKHISVRNEYRKEFIKKNPDYMLWQIPYPKGESFIDDIKPKAKKLLDEIKNSSDKATLVCSHQSPSRALEILYYGYGDKKSEIPSYYSEKYCNAQSKEFVFIEPENTLDKWILSELQSLIDEVSKGFEIYDIQKTSDAFSPFLDKLNNWYIRRNRKRFWKSENDEDKMKAYETLWFVLDTFNKLLAPFCPFITDFVYDHLRSDIKTYDSVHLDYFPSVNMNLIDKDLENLTNTVREIVSLGLTIRAKNQIKVRQPLAEAHITVGNEKLMEQIKKQEEVIKEELNVKKIIWEKNASKIANVSLSPDARKIGPRLGNKVQEIIIEAKKGNYKELDNKEVAVAGEKLTREEYEFRYEPTGELEAEGRGNILVGLDTQLTDELRIEGFLRDLIREIQESRKEANFEISDRIEIGIELDKFNFNKEHINTIKSETLTKEIHTSLDKVDFEKEIEIDGIKLILQLKK